MDTTHLCTHLNLPDAILDHSILHLHDYTPYRVSESYLNPVVSKLLKDKGFRIDSVELFRVGPGCPELTIHIDDSPFFHNGHVFEDIGKLNWAYGNLDCKVTWFKEREGTKRKNSVNRFAPFIEYAKEDVEEIASVSMGRNAIIQTAIPHTVYNYTDTMWHCVGVHVSHEGYPKVTYDLLLDKFKEFII